MSLNFTDWVMVTTSITIASGVIVGGIWAVITRLTDNHLKHMEENIIGAVNDSGKETQSAIKDSTTAIRLALLEKR